MSAPRNNGKARERINPRAAEALGSTAGQQEETAYAPGFHPGTQSNSSIPSLFSSSSSADQQTPSTAGSNNLELQHTVDQMLHSAMQVRREPTINSEPVTDPIITACR